jgi:hypothetical protein
LRKREVSAAISSRSPEESGDGPRIKNIPKAYTILATARVECEVEGD